MTTLRVIGTAIVDEDEQPTFAAFWLLYPKRVAKFDAERAWKRLSIADQLDAIIGLVAWRQVWVRENRPQFIPLGATWLNGHRWEDELPDQWVASSPASHKPAQIDAKTERAVMPDHVKALIAKMKVKP